MHDVLVDGMKYVEKIPGKEHLPMANPGSDHPFVIGQAYLLRCVTYHHIGEVCHIQGKFLTLKGASWLADSGRFGECLRTGGVRELEYAGTIYVNIDTIVDAFPWTNPLPGRTVG